jgi:hypothetical protein
MSSSAVNFAGLKPPLRIWATPGVYLEGFFLRVSEGNVRYLFEEFSVMLSIFHVLLVSQFKFRPGSRHTLSHQHYFPSIISHNREPSAQLLFYPSGMPINLRMIILSYFDKLERIPDQAQLNPFKRLK